LIKTRRIFKTRKSCFVIYRSAGKINPITPTPSHPKGKCLGGYFAFGMAKELSIDAILFNPALHSRSFEPDMTAHKNEKHKPYIHSVLERMKLLSILTKP